MGDLLPRPFFSEFRSTSFIVERDGKVVAFLVDFLSQTNSDEAYTHAVAVAPAWRGRGLVRVLYERFGEVGKRRGRRRTRTITSLAEAAVASDWSSIAVHASAHAAFRRWFAWIPPTLREMKRASRIT